MLELTLVIVQDVGAGNVLLGEKKTGLGAGYWNGFGGKIEEGETALDGARRELEEETGLIAMEIEQVGTVAFEYKNTEELEAGLKRENIGKKFLMHVFRVTEWSGEPVEGREMRPRWFSIDTIPYDHMWPDDEYWLPLAIGGNKFEMKCVLLDKTTMLSHQIISIDEYSRPLPLAGGEIAPR